MVDETRIGSYIIYPHNTPIKCLYRVWVGPKPHCTIGNRAAITVTDDGDTILAPSCCEKQCTQVEDNK